MNRRTWLLGAALAAAPLFALGGCATGPADMTGRVTHQGKPVVAGVVLVRGSDGIEMTGTIAPDGSYTVRGVAPGAVKLAVVSRDPAAIARARDRKEKGEGKPETDQPAAAAPSGGWFPLPAKYETVDQSGLETTLKSGANQFDVVLP